MSGNPFQGKCCHVLVEGHGEVEAVQNLLTRVSAEQEIYFPWAHPLRWLNLHQWEPEKRWGVRAGVELIRGKPDAGGLLILRDEDDACPRETAPEMAERLRDLSLPFPTAVVLMHPEYEVLFLPCLHLMASFGFPPGLHWDRDSWEARRGVKEWLSNQLPRGRRYKPTVDQLPMTRRIDISTLHDAQVPCFGSLERGIAFLGQNWAQPGAVYPPP